MVRLEEIIKVHSAMVRRIATVYERYPDEVDDLVQDVWFAVWQALPRLHDQAMLKGYIARITQNICVTQVRRALVRQTEPLTDTQPDPTPPIDEAAEHAARLVCLSGAQGEDGFRKCSCLTEAESVAGDCGQGAA